MKRDPLDKILLDRVPQRIRDAAGDNGTIVFMNGCFGMVHPGHARYLFESSRLGSVLVVAVNSDRTYELLRGRPAPMPWLDRATLLASLECVDFVAQLDAPTPHFLLRSIRPDYLVKSDSSDLPPCGHEIVEGYGGHVVVLPSFGGYSTTRLLGLQAMANSLEPDYVSDWMIPAEVPRC